MPDPDWLKWYEGYDTSPDRQARLRFVRWHIARCLDSFPAGPIGAISVCAGDGRDLVGVLSSHNRARDVTAWLVEINHVLVDRGREAIARSDLRSVLTYVVADATLFSAYAPMAPADLVIVAGVFGNLRPSEVPRLIAGLPYLCRLDGAVIWTRHRLYNDGPSALPRIRGAFEDVGFEGVAEDVTSEAGYVIGSHRYRGPSVPAPKDQRWFEFGGVE